MPDSSERERAPVETVPAPSSPDDDRPARALRGFGPLGLLAVLVVFAGNFLFPPLSALLALGWAKRSRTPLAALGFVRPRHLVAEAVLGLVLGAVFKMVMKAAVMPLLGGPAVNPAFHFIEQNPSALVAMSFASLIVAGFGEETLYRGYLFERLGHAMGEGPAARAAIIVISSMIFAAAHFREQGLAGAEQALATGLVLGSIFAVRRSLWPVMWIHAGFDLAAVLMIFTGSEARFAHLIFR